MCGAWVKVAMHRKVMVHRVVVCSVKLHACNAYRGHGALGLCTVNRTSSIRYSMWPQKNSNPLLYEPCSSLETPFSMQRDQRVLI